MYLMCMEKNEKIETVTLSDVSFDSENVEKTYKFLVSKFHIASPSHPPPTPNIRFVLFFLSATIRDIIQKSGDAHAVSRGISTATNVLSYSHRGDK